MLKKQSFGLLAICCLLAATTLAQQNFWEPTGGPITGAVRVLALNTEGHLFAGTSRAGVYRSLNQGQSWDQILYFTPSNLTTNEVRSIALNTQGHVFAVVRNGLGVYRSTDNGTSWNQLTVGLPSTEVLCLVIDQQDQITAGTPNGVYQSSDNGDSWLPGNNMLDTLAVNGLCVRPGGGLFASTEAGVFRSADNGNSWDNTGLNIPLNHCVAGANGYVFAAADSSLFRSDNNGESWDSLDWSLGPIYTIELNSNGAVFVGSEAGLFRSENNGTSWQATGLNTGRVTAVAFNADNDCLAGSDRGVFISSNQGNTWGPISKGMGNTSVLAFAESPAGFLFAGTRASATARGGSQTFLEGGLFRSSDNGNTWVPVWSSLGDFPTVHATSQGTVLVTITTNDISGGSVYNYRSADHGETWEDMDIPSGLVAEFVNKDTSCVFACAVGYSYGFGHRYAIGGIYKSTDDGITWDTLLLDTSGCRTLVINPQGELFAGLYDSVLRSVDNGVSWMPASTGLPVPGIRRLAVDSQGRLFASYYYDGIYRSVNNGDSWEALLGLDLNGEYISDLEIDASDHIYAATSGGVFYSTDNGDSWNTLNTGLTNTDVNTIMATTSGGLFAGTSGNGAFRKAESSTAVKAVPGATNTGQALGQIRPNPVREYAKIPFAIYEAGPAKMVVYDITGREVLTLFNEVFKPGNYELGFSPGDLAQGLYFYSLITGNQRHTKKMTILGQSY